nr:YnfA family protein [Fodinibius salsisoli]
MAHSSKFINLPQEFNSFKLLNQSDMVYLKSIFYFILAGLLEIGGGYLVWIWLRDSKSWVYGLSGMVVLALYGFIPTLQPAHFGRVYAAYGGVFIVLSLLWGWKVDGIQPDKYDLIGAMLALIGVAVMMYWPRSG